tara:strand:- start:2236 stop:2463 length:228 start_codon:yes stop_codon:yes gene_type:complete
MKGMILSNTNVSNEFARSRQHARQDTRQLTTQAKSQHDEIKAEFKEMKEEMQMYVSCLMNGLPSTNEIERKTNDY